MTTHWKPLSLSVSTVLLLLCVVIIISPTLRTLALSLDQAITLFLNHLFISKKIGLELWQYTNKNAQGIRDIIPILCLAAFYIYTSNNKSLALANIISLIFYLELLCFIKWEFASYFNISRDSPSLFLEGYIKISELMNDPTIKDASTRSIPGDHALVLIFIATYVTAFYPRRLQIITWILAILIVIPRLIVGAHWPSDVLLGAVIAIFYGQLLISTPIHYYTSNKISHYLKKYLFIKK